MKILLFANTDWYLFNFRRSLALALRDAGHDVLLLSPPGPFGARLIELGLRWEPAPMQRRSLNPFSELALLLWLRTLLRREGIQLVHSFTIKCAVYGSLAARFAGISARVNAVTGMGYVFTSDDLKARLLRPVVRSLLRMALNGRQTRLILQNPDDAALVCAAGLANESIIRIIPGSGVDCTRFIPAASYQAEKPGGTLKVVLPARILWDKGLAEFVLAARHLRAQDQRLEFILAGDLDMGNPSAVPRITVQGWVAEGIVTWLGHVEDMPTLFQTADIVVLPSYREGLPKGLIEAAACGLPLITTDVPGCREVVTHEVDGLLVPVRDAQALMNAIARLRDDADLRRRLGRAAREKAVTVFDEQSVIDRTLDVYGEVMEG